MFLSYRLHQRKVILAEDWEIEYLYLYADLDRLRV